MLKRLIFCTIIFALFFVSFTNLSAKEDEKLTSPWTLQNGNNLIFGVPNKVDLILHKNVFSIGYSYKYRQAVWVCYVLFADNLKLPQVKRSNNFKTDFSVKNPTTPQDYTRSGYDRGHLAPAADMTYSIQAMEDSFLMTNISPQIPGCNRGIWRRVETQVRKWAYQEEILYIITGPIFDDQSNKKLGKTDIPVPVAFYKIVFDMTPPCKMIGFIVPNQTTKKRVPSFVVSVDEIEKITSNDFFSALPDEDENALESQKDFKSWDHSTSNR